MKRSWYSLALFSTSAALILGAIAGWVTCASAVNLVPNGDFEDSWYPDPGGTVPPTDTIPYGWTKHETDWGSGGEYSYIFPDHGDNGPLCAGSTSLHWIRSGGGSSGDWTQVRREDLNIDVASYPGLQLCLDIKAIYHDLGGSGNTAEEWEYPVCIMILYEDINGISRWWMYGWYCHLDHNTGPPPWGYITPDGMIVYSQEVVCGLWYSVCLDLVPLMTPLAPPATITRIRLGGSGWNFEGKADNLHLGVGEPSLNETTTWGGIKRLFE
jgi:hypothetical protein